MRGDVKHVHYWLLPFVVCMTAIPISAAKWRMDPVSGEDAIADFKRICVDNFLDAKALSEELASEKSRWVALKPLPKVYLNYGRYWRSSTGEVGHITSPSQPLVINDPACHFTFVQSSKDTHGSLIGLATSYLQLGVGYDTGKPKINQQRWDFQEVGGVQTRIFVTSNLELDGLIVSRFSISKHRLGEPASKAN
jgi:hypothetical protein